MLCKPLDSIVAKIILLSDVSNKLQRLNENGLTEVARRTPNINSNLWRIIQKFEPTRSAHKHQAHRLYPAACAESSSVQFYESTHTKKKTISWLGEHNVYS